MQRIIVSTSLVLGFCTVALAQRPGDVVRWTLAGPAGTVKAGAATTFHLTADIEPGWHLYALTQPDGGPRPLEVKAAKGSPLSVINEKIQAPQPKVERDPSFDLETLYYDEKTTLTVPVRVAATTPPGTRTVSVEVSFQACNGRLCLRPTTEMLRVAITTSAGTPRKNLR